MPSKVWDEIIYPFPNFSGVAQTSLLLILFNGAWWRHQMETFSALLVICAGNSPVPGEFPTQRPVTRSFDVFFDLRLNKQLNKQSWGWWFETLSRSLWRHCNGLSAVVPCAKFCNDTLPYYGARLKHIPIEFELRWKNRSWNEPQVRFIVESSFRAGVGVAALVVSWYILIYFNVIISWCLFFLFSSFTDPLPWTTCDNSWNTPACLARGRLLTQWPLGDVTVVSN